MEDPHHPPNELFQQARVQLFGTREALADAVNAHLPPGFLVTANDIGKIERGMVTFPRSPRRAAFRRVLQVETDAAIGFRNRRGELASQSDTTDVRALGNGDFGPAESSGDEGIVQRTSPDPNNTGGARLSVASDGNDRGHGKNAFGDHALARMDTVETGLVAGATMDADLVDLLSVLDDAGVRGAELTAAELAGERLDQAFAQREPGQSLVKVHAMLSAVTGQLRMPQSLNHQRRLIALASRLAGLRAWGYFDIDQHNAAERWYEAAVSAAETADAWSLGAWLLGAQSLIPWHRGDRRGAVALIAKGIYFAGNGADSTTTAWLHALHARGRASLGDLDGFERAYGLAEEAADCSNERDRRHGMDFHQGILDLRYYAGTSRLLLRQPKLANISLGGSLTSLPESHVKARAVLTLCVADAAVQSDNLDEAVQLASEAVTSTMHQPIMPVLQQARRIRRQSAQRGMRNTVELDSWLAAFAVALASESAQVVS
jgi:hypothetical protein